MSGDDVGWKREWTTTEHMAVWEHDYDGDSPVSVDECPRCAAIVRTENRPKHEVVCWGPEIVEVSVRQSPLLDNEDIRYRLTATAAVGQYQQGFAVECTRQYLTDTHEPMTYLLARLDQQITEARQRLG